MLPLTASTLFFGFAKINWFEKFVDTSKEFQILDNVLSMCDATNLNVQLFNFPSTLSKHPNGKINVRDGGGGQGGKSRDEGGERRGRRRDEEVYEEGVGRDEGKGMAGRGYGVEGANR